MKSLIQMLIWSNLFQTMKTIAAHNNQCEINRIRTRFAAQGSLNFRRL